MRTCSVARDLYLSNSAYLARYIDATLVSFIDPRTPAPGRVLFTSDHPFLSMEQAVRRRIYPLRHSGPGLPGRHSGPPPRPRLNKRPGTAPLGRSRRTPLPSRHGPRPGRCVVERRGRGGRQPHAQCGARSSSRSATRPCGASGRFDPRLYPHFARLLGSTARVRMASGIVSVCRRYRPRRRARLAALEDDPGRFLLGIGASHAPAVENYDHPYAHVVAYLDTLDALDVPVPPERRCSPPSARMLRLAPHTPPARPSTSSPSSTARPTASSAGAAPRPRWRSSSTTHDRPGARAAYAAAYLRLPNYTNDLRTLSFGDDDISGGGSDRLIDAVVPWGDVCATITSRVPRAPRRRADQRLRPGRQPAGRPSRWTATATGSTLLGTYEVGARPEPLRRPTVLGEQHARARRPRPVRRGVFSAGVVSAKVQPSPSAGSTRSIARSRASRRPGRDRSLHRPSAHTCEPSGKAASATVLKRPRRCAAAVVQHGEPRSSLATLSA